LMQCAARLLDLSWVDDSRRRIDPSGRVAA
jgi:hypothetical protein